MAQVGLSQSWLNAMSRQIEEIVSTGLQQSEDNVRFLHESIVERARRTPGWEQLADQIDVWSQDGIMWIGVRNEQYVSQAWLQEYGDENHPPNPLFRTTGGELRETNDMARSAAVMRFGMENVK